jgi:DNA (cytosine-5)-methyltransferase 1
MRIMAKRNQIKAVDFFSGAGGLTYGLRSAGIKVIAGIDIDKSCKETYEKNNKGSIYLEKDITQYLPEELAKELGIKTNDDYMLFAGCAPCQFWSIIHTSKEKSKKTKNLILDFQKFIEYFKPGFVLVENVPGISSKEGSPMNDFIKTLKSLGYNVDHDITDMSKFGIPQKRRRFTLLASRISKIELPDIPNKRTTLRDVIGQKNGFPQIVAGTKDKTLYLHTVASLSPKNIERLKMTKKDGGDRSDWQNNKDYQLNCYASGEKKFYDTYARMWWDKPAPTITTKFYSISNGRFAHPEENRAISLREGATIQTFPKTYEFIGNSVVTISRMIGNAVPPKFGKILGEQIIKSLDE